MSIKVNHPHFERFPQLQPYVGENYGNGKAKRLLILGESHYQPKGATKHLNPEVWYNQLSHKDLGEEEHGWTDTAGIVLEARDVDITLRAYRIYMNIAKELNALGLRYENYTDALLHIMYMNYFQRPAEETGKSIRVTGIDRQMAESVMRAVLRDCQPELVIIVSKLAADNNAWRVFDEMGIPYAVTPHPACVWWNKYAGKYGNRRGRDVFNDFLKEHDWVHTS